MTIKRLKNNLVTIKHQNLPAGKFLWRLVLLAIIGCAATAASGFAKDAATDGYGFIFDRFKLTLEDGWRTEAAGPFFYSEQSESGTTWALPPFFSSADNPAIENHEDDFLYPLLTYEWYGKEYRWQFFQLLSFAGGQEADDTAKKRFTIYPFYFQQRALNPDDNYTAVVPFYGHIKNRLLINDVFFILFPLYSETRKKDVVTDNYLYPFFHVRHGDGLRGWQVWPIVGREHKDVTTATNGFGDTALVPGHDKSFLLWPIHLRQHTGIGTENPEKLTAEIPFYVGLRSPQRDATSVLWPFFTWIDERGKKYHEWQGPWPFVIFTRGEGKTTSRVWPLFSQSHNESTESDSYAWPIYRYKWVHSGALDLRRSTVFFYLYTGLTEKNTGTGAVKKRRDMWPFFIWRQEFNGDTRLQVLAPLESILGNSRGIERNWSPLWSFWRAQANVKTGAASQSLLWNLYRRETAPAHKKISLLFGLFQYQCEGESGETRWFYFYHHQSQASGK